MTLAIPNPLSEVEKNFLPKRWAFHRNILLENRYCQIGAQTFRQTWAVAVGLVDSAVAPIFEGLRLESSHRPNLY